MNMKVHMLSALREQFDSWEELLASLSPEQVVAPQFDLDWSIKDVVSHLWAWQQISIARFEAALLNCEPAYPSWLGQAQANWEEDADQTNERIHRISREMSWTEVHQLWREGFLRLLDAGQSIAETDLLDWDKYPWLNGHSLAGVLLGTYGHHQEHLENLLAWRYAQN